MVDQNLIGRYIKKLKYIAEKDFAKGDNETGMAAISACAQILYNYNQYYMDETLEKFVGKLARIVDVSGDYVMDGNTVLFYDGFGLDLRGWAASFVKALVACGYRLIYVTARKSADKIPHIQKELGNNVAVYINTDRYVTHIKELNEAFAKYHPKVAFFYTAPNDVSGAVVFRAYQGKVKRIQVDLTDHAFWLGVKSVDIFFESREIGACIAIRERGVARESIVRLDCVPYISRDTCDKPLPFDIKTERYVFSGGALYKTLGDPQLLYYKALREMLVSDPNIKFLYAGSGDVSQMNLLQSEFSGRVFLIAERPDFFELIENSVFYLNTYPMFGGLMMRYGALAGKLPITLKHENDADGILFNQKELDIEFDVYDDFISEIKRVLKDDDYRKSKEMKMHESIMNDESFRRNLHMLIENGTTEYSFGELPQIDTTKFRREYLERFDVWSDLESVIAWKKHIMLAKYFPGIFLKKIICKLVRSK